MQVEQYSVWAQKVEGCSWHQVDSYFTVDVFDPVLYGADVSVGNGSTISKVQSYTGGGAISL